MKKEDLTDEQKALTKKGLSDEVAVFLTEGNNGSKMLNSEGLELGNIIVIDKISDKVSKSVIKGEERQWLTVDVTGDARTVSVSRLVGTPKRAKYFAADRDGTVIIEGGYDSAKLLNLPPSLTDAVLAIKKLHGKKFKVVAVAEECGSFKSKYVLFEQI